MARWFLVLQPQQCKKRRPCLPVLSQEQECLSQKLPIKPPFMILGQRWLPCAILKPYTGKGNGTVEDWLRAAPLSPSAMCKRGHTWTRSRFIAQRGGMALGLEAISFQFHIYQTSVNRQFMCLTSHYFPTSGATRARSCCISPAPSTISETQWEPS